MQVVPGPLVGRQVDTGLLEQLLVEPQADGVVRRRNAVGDVLVGVQLLHGLGIVREVELAVVDGGLEGHELLVAGIQLEVGTVHHEGVRQVVPRRLGLQPGEEVLEGALGHLHGDVRILLVEPVDHGGPVEVGLPDRELDRGRHLGVGDVDIAAGATASATVAASCGGESREGHPGQNSTSFHDIPLCSHGRCGLSCGVARERSCRCGGASRRRGRPVRLSPHPLLADGGERRAAKVTVVKSNRSPR